MIKAGDLRHKVTLKKRIGTYTDGQGVTREAWKNYIAFWAAVEPLQGRELYTAQAIDRKATVKIRARHNPTIAAETDFLKAEVQGGRIYDVLSIPEADNHRTEIKLLCGNEMVFDKICKVYRVINKTGNLNRIEQLPPALIGTYPCTVCYRKAEYNQETPNATVESTLMLYSISAMDIMPGDLVEVDGIKYVASVPFRPRNHHTEVEIIYIGDA